MNRFKLNVQTNASCVDILVWAAREENGMHYMQELKIRLRWIRNMSASWIRILIGWIRNMLASCIRIPIRWIQKMLASWIRIPIRWIWNMLAFCIRIPIRWIRNMLVSCTWIPTHWIRNMLASGPGSLRTLNIWINGFGSNGQNIYQNLQKNLMFSKQNLNCQLQRDY